MSILKPETCLIKRRQLAGNKTSERQLVHRSGPGKRQAGGWFDIAKKHIGNPSAFRTGKPGSYQSVNSIEAASENKRATAYEHQYYRVELFGSTFDYTDISGSERQRSAVADAFRIRCFSKDNHTHTAFLSAFSKRAPAS